MLPGPVVELAYHPGRVQRPRSQPGPALARGRSLIFRQPARGAVRAIKVPGSADDNWIVTAQGRRLLINADMRCVNHSSLLWFNPATGQEQMLVKAPRGRAGLLGVVPYGPPISNWSISYGCPAGSSGQARHSPGAGGFAPGLLRS
jgi:hypothetical protein